MGPEQAVQMLCQLGTDLSGISVNSLLSTENRVKPAFQFLHFLDGLTDDIAGCQCIELRAAESGGSYFRRNNHEHTCLRETGAGYHRNKD